MLFPYHKYLGPGNEINYEEPIDADDRIALLHDLAYAEADCDFVIRQSDVIAINSFLDDFRETGNWHSIIGVYGLLIKYVSEEVLGPIYPKIMAPVGSSTHRGNYLYSRKQKQNKELRDAYIKATNHHVSWSDWLKTFGNPRTYGELRMKLSDAGVAELPHWTEAPEQESQIPGPSRFPGTGQITGVRTKKRTTTAEPSDSDSVVESPITAASSRRKGTSSSTTAASQLRAAEVGTFAPGSPDVEYVPSMDVDPEQVDLTDPQSSNAGTGGMSGTISHSANIHIPRSITNNSYSFTIRKSRIMFTSGYGIRPLDELTNNKTYLTTPLAYVPVDVLGWYMNDTEFKNLHGFARVLHVSTKCIVLGTRTSFITGSSITSQATHEHVPIVISAIGLGSKCYHEIHDYTVGSDAQMIPTALKNYDLQGEIAKYYGKPDDANNIGCAQLATRKMGGYCVLVNNKEKAGIPSTKHDEGWYQLDTQCTRNLVNSVIGKDILNYSYKPRSGVLHAKHHDLPLGTTKSGSAIIAASATGHTKPGSTVMLGTQVKMVADGVTQITESPMATTDAKTFSASKNGLAQPIDNIYIQHTGYVDHVTHPQPRAYVGLLPQQHVNPGSPVTDFLNANILFNFETSITIHIDANSIYGHTTTLHGRPDEHYVETTVGSYNYNAIHPFNLQGYQQ